MIPSWFDIFLLEAKTTYWMKKRNIGETALGLVVAAVFFACFAAAIGALNDAALKSGRTYEVLMSFVIWIFAAGSYSSASSSITEMIRGRTLEQVYLTPAPASGILLARSAISLSIALCYCVLLFLIAITISPQQVSPAGFIYSILVALISSISLVGVGLAVAGAMLILKRAEIIHALVYPSLIGIIAASAKISPWKIFLPFCYGAHEMTAVMGNGHLSPSTIALVTFNSAVYMAIGLMMFRFFEKKAISSGSLSHT